MSDPRKRSCEAWQSNRRVSDFTCRLDAGHGGPHKDPRAGTAWGEPKVPLGMRRKPR